MNFRLMCGHVRWITLFDNWLRVCHEDCVQCSGDGWVR